MQTREIKKDTKLSRRTRVATGLIVAAIPAVIAFGMLVLDDRNYYAISLIIIGLAMLPFVLVFEDRKPQARELVTIAVLVAIAVAGRAAFFAIPQFKPVTAIVIIAGVCFGAESGFIVGALSGFASNFIFGQGPWTPWQMFAFGIIGFLAGILFRKGLLPKKPLPLCIFGGLSTFFIYGLIMDTASVLMFSHTISWPMLLTYYLAGLPMNAIHTAATVIFLLLLSQLMIEKLDRIKVKYGILEP